MLVICTGGGGIPVLRTPGGALRGVEAVIDKDLAAALLATRLRADALLLLTDVPALFLDWPTPAQQAIREVAPPALRERSWAPGSMGPKVEAACRFVEATGGTALIGALGEAPRLLDGTCGTRVSADAPTQLHVPGDPAP